VKREFLTARESNPMSGTLEKNHSKNKKLWSKRTSKIIYVQESLLKDGSKKAKKQRNERKKECGNELKERTEPREPSGWDTRPLGKDGVPASDLRYKVFDEMRSRGYKGRNAVAKMFGVSGAFVTKWTRILRAAAEAGAGIRNACRALPTRPPGKITSPVSDAVEEVVLSARKKYPFLGPEKIRVMYKPKASPSTIGRIIKKLGLRREHVPYKRHKYVRYEKPFPLYMIQIDYKQWADGVYSIWAIDDHSRMILGHRVVASATAAAAIDLVHEVVSVYGPVIIVLSDHGTQFTTMHADGEHVFEAEMEKLEIKHVMGRVKHPQTQGKIERSHGSAKTEMEAVWGGKPETLEEYGGAIGAWIEFHNNVRPHQSLDYKTPSEVFSENMIGTDDPIWTEAVEKERFRSASC